MQENNGTVKVTPDNRIECDSCKCVADHTDVNLYHINMREGFRVGAMCRTCYTIAKNIFRLEPQEGSDKDETQVISHPEMKHMNLAHIELLNKEIIGAVKVIADKYGINYTEAHKQIRETAMEYNFVVKTKSDVEPAPVTVQPVTKTKPILKSVGIGNSNKNKKNKIQLTKSGVK